jgi:hypothetical protein
MLIVTGCQNDKPEIRNIPVPIAKIPLDIPLPEPINFHEMQFSVITDKTASAFFSKSLAEKKLPVQVCMSPKIYENMAKNQAMQEEYIRKLIATINAYKEYYENPDITVK